MNNVCPPLRHHAWCFAALELPCSTVHPHSPLSQLLATTSAFFTMSQSRNNTATSQIGFFHPVPSTEDSCNFKDKEAKAKDQTCSSQDPPPSPAGQRQCRAGRCSSSSPPPGRGQRGARQDCVTHAVGPSSKTEA